MMMKQLLAATAISLGLAMAAPAQADTLLMQQVNKENQIAMPTRGMTMAQVKRKFGAPLSKLPTRGGDAPKHPPINRWQYANYIVYFERSHVIHAVINPPSNDTNS